MINVLGGLAYLFTGFALLSVIVAFRKVSFPKSHDVAEAGAIGFVFFVVILFWPCFLFLALLFSACVVFTNYIEGLAND